MKSFVLILSVVLIVVIRVAAQVEDFPSVNFHKADSVARLYPHHSLENLQILADKLTTPLATEVEKFRAIYTWVCLNIESDYELFNKYKSKRNKLQQNPAAWSAWNREFSIEVIKILRRHNRTLCTGYAFIVRELAGKAGIPCEIVNGYGRTAQSNVGESGTPNHSWNVVRLNGKLYLCDPTWSSGTYDAQQNKFVQQYNDIYFLLEPTSFVRNHYPLDTTRILLANKPTLSEFLNRPLIYPGIFKYNMAPLLPGRFNIQATKGEPVSFQFARYNAAEKIDPIDIGLQIVGSATSHQVSPHLERSGDCISFDHTFTTKGMYTIHLLVDGKPVVTWELSVR